MVNNDFSDITIDPVVVIPLPVNRAVPGTILRTKIRTENWNFGRERAELDCGLFEITASNFTGPVDVMKINAVSTPVSSSLRRETKCRAWEETTLEKIAQDMASEAGLDLMYEVDGNIELDRVDQIQKTDLAFLRDLCRDYGVALKVTDRKMVLFDESAYEKRPAVETFNKSEMRTSANSGGRILNYSFWQDTSDTVKRVELYYKDLKSGRLVQAIFNVPNPPATGQVLRINQRPGDLRGDNYREGTSAFSDIASGTFPTGFAPFNDTECDFESIRADTTDNAMRIAKARARDKNKKEWTVELTVMGNINLVGAATIMIVGFGVYAGKYYINRANHRVGRSGYITTIFGHRVLEGY